MQLSKKVTLLGMATFLLTLASLTTSANSPRTFVQAGAIARNRAHHLGWQREG